MENLAAHFAALIFEPAPEVKRGRPRINGAAMPAAERKQRQRSREPDIEHKIAILDFETDPFDNQRPELLIEPFLAVLYSEEFEPIVIWDEKRESFLAKVVAAIEALPGKFTIYAHNGGKFDYMFLIHKLRGYVSFKGRGIMAAKIGSHELRDSFHIIPEKLANLQKDDFDYTRMARSNRNKFRQQIIDYCLNDCKYLYSYVTEFIKKFGLRISIGQAAMYELRKSYKVQQIGCNMDAYLRNHFFGGRVECIAGRGHFVGPYKLFDVNSMYPDCMARYQHPIGNQYEIRHGKPGPHTIFIDLNCVNHGALVKRSETNETTAEIERGNFLTTIWEYETALRLGLIENVKINYCIDCELRSNFEQFVTPLYSSRLGTKELLGRLEEGSYEHNDAKKDDTFYKLILNNAYGKFAQNPRKFKENFLTEPSERPYPVSEKEDTKEWANSWGVLPHYECDDYWIWQRPTPLMRFNNVGTAASITGAARAVLMEAIHNAVDPIYCDTDSIICRELPGVEIDKTKLGAWDLEASYSEVLIAGKKLYAVKYADSGKTKIKSKGVSALIWNDVQRILDDEIIEVINKAPTLTRYHEQYYIRRQIRATAPIKRKAASWETSQSRKPASQFRIA